MFMFGYRCKVFLNIYNRNMIVDQKRKLGYVLVMIINNLDYNIIKKLDMLINIFLFFVFVYVLFEIF